MAAARVTFSIWMFLGVCSVEKLLWLERGAVVRPSTELQPQHFSVKVVKLRISEKSTVPILSLPPNICSPSSMICSARSASIYRDMVDFMRFSLLISSTITSTPNDSPSFPARGMIVRLVDNLLPPKEAASSFRVHVVDWGENLSNIAKRYKVPVSKLIAFNNITLEPKILLKCYPMLEPIQFK